jgi:hypothetical protein
LLHPLVLRESVRPHTETATKTHGIRNANQGLNLRNRVVPFTIGSAPSPKLRLVASHQAASSDWLTLSQPREFRSNAQPSGAALASSGVSGHALAGVRDSGAAGTRSYRGAITPLLVPPPSVPVLPTSNQTSLAQSSLAQQSSALGLTGLGSPVTAGLAPVFPQPEFLPEKSET